MKLLEQGGTSSGTAETELAAWHGPLRETRTDVLAVEEPLEIRLAGCSVAVTMRTPGDDFDLALGFLYTEGIIHGMSDVASIVYCQSAAGGLEPNIVNVNPVDPSLVDPDRWRRNFFATSSCGICGKASIDKVLQDIPVSPSPSRETTPTGVSSACLYTLDRQLRQAQDAFSRTGGLHAAGLFTRDGRLLLVREDVGRHNAVDKVVGHFLQAGGLPLEDAILVVSGRASFEIVQKAAMAGIRIVAAVSAPSTLAVELARETGMTLIGFLRGGEAVERTGRFNVYAGQERIA